MKITDGKCAECGSTDFLLAEDMVQTRYTDVTYDAAAGKWVKGKSRTEDDENQTDDPTRLFCTACSEYYVVPEELT